MVAENHGNDGVTTAAQSSGYVNRDELLSLRVVAGQKRIFLALCENDRGRYLKISDGRSKLIVPGPGFPELRNAIDSLHDFVTDGSVDTARISVDRQTAASASSQVNTASGPGGVRSNRTPPEPLHAERFISEGRKFYLDLLENSRGLYIKFSQATTRRISMIFPASALRHLRDAMSQLEELAPPDPAVRNSSTTGHSTRTVERQTPLQSGGAVVMKAVQRELRVEGKRIVFESGANRRGSYLRITDSSGVTKMSVTVPHSAIPSIITLLKEVEEAGDPVEDFQTAVAEAAAEGRAQE